VDERLRFIAQVKTCNDSFSELCRQFGISRKTGYKWLERYEQEGPSALEDRAPIARRIRHKLPRDLVANILGVRKDHPSWGPRKIRAWLIEQRAERIPAASSIGELLKQYGLVTEARRSPRRPRAPIELKPTNQPNDTWCVDFKGHFATKNGRRCHPLTISDHHTRYLLKCEALRHPDERHVRPHFERAFYEFGLPDRIRSDNGPPFATVGLGGLSKLSVWWIKLGIGIERIAPGHPEQNGRHERIHRTMKADVPPQLDLGEQQLAFDRFRYTYNEVRPHEALGMKPPAKYYRPSRRRLPAKLEPLEYPGMEVRKVDRDGRIRFQGSERILVSSVLSLENVGIDRIDDDRWAVYFGPVLLACLDVRGREIEVRPVTHPPVLDDSGLGLLSKSTSPLGRDSPTD
jgi:transposase InsO family protein